MRNSQYPKIVAGARRILTAGQRIRRRIWAPGNYGFIVLFILGALTVLTVMLGLSMEGSASPPPQVPVPPSMSLSFTPGSTPPASLSIYTFLEEEETPVKLIVAASGVFAMRQSSISWTLDIQGFTGYICPGQASLRMIPFIQQGNNDYYISATSPVPPDEGASFFAVQLCWDHGAPLITSGSYISAALSPVLASDGQSGTVTRSLVLSGSSLSSYSLAGGIPPTEESARAWIWTSSLSADIQNQARYEIPIIASSLPGIQRDNQNAFYAGILFGIAGGAAVSIIPALLDAIDRYKCRENPAAGNGDHTPTAARPAHMPKGHATAAERD